MAKNRPPSNGHDTSWVRELILALLAAGSACIGVTLSYFNAREIYGERMQAVSRDAQALAAVARSNLVDRLRDLMTQAKAQANFSGDSSPDTGYYPRGTLLRNLFLWDGAFLRPLYGEVPTDERLLARVTEILNREEIRSGAARTQDEAPKIYFRNLPDTPVFVAFTEPFRRTDQSSAALSPYRRYRIVGLVVKSRMPSNLLGGEQEFRTDLELIQTDNPIEADGTPLDPEIPHWRVRVTSAFRQRQEEIMLQQLVFFGPVTGLCLAALVGMIWQLSRVVERERNLSELKSQFVANVSHELNTPLALIRLYAETLTEGRIADEQTRLKYFHVIFRESNRLGYLIENLLEYSRGGATRGKPPFRVEDVGQLLREVYEAYRLDLDHQGVHHALVIEPDLPRINMDRHALTQALLNLMNNAVKYSEDEKDLLVEAMRETRRGAAGVLISVHDRGIGVPPEDRFRIFEGFYRVNRPQVLERRGAGLGLALVKQTVENHGGQVWVEPRLTKGSTFRIFLPGVQADPAKDTPTSLIEAMPDSAPREV